MPFAPFTGVNQHLQSMLFGGALLEENKGYICVVVHLVSRCMFNRASNAIITNQDAAICWAVGQVFPESRHRYCLWHVRKHELEHLQELGSRFPNFDQVYQRCSETIHPQTSRRSGITFARNSVSSHVICYLGCTRNAITG